jgi:hypothetical protein
MPKPLYVHPLTAVVMGMEPLQPHLHGCFIPAICQLGEPWAWRLDPELEDELTAKEKALCLTLKLSRQLMKRSLPGRDTFGPSSA